MFTRLENVGGFVWVFFLSFELGEFQGTVNNGFSIPVNKLFWALKLQPIRLNSGGVMDAATTIQPAVWGGSMLN